jgi:tRNA dimethylallyltransferase
VTTSVLVLAGPTAAGKTAAALAVAERFDAVIVSADAMQVYRGMDIGTGKATPEEQDRAPHFGIDLRAPDEAFDASDFVALADGVCAVYPRVVLAGGTALYLRAFLRGLVATPKVDPDLRARLSELDDPYEALAAVDPALARRLDPNDRVRIVRGLEVHAQTGRPLSDLQRDHAAAPDRVEAVERWLDRPDLDTRIDARVVEMRERGLAAEVRALLDQGFGRDLKPMRSLGYRHLCDHWLDGLDLDEGLRRTARDTRRLARKQRTWMRGLGFSPPDASDPVDVALRAAEAAFAR